MSGTSTIEVSSTTSRSQSSGASSVRRKAPVLGSVSSRRWMVFASSPVLSDRRLAARPVGAQSAIAAGLAPKNFRSEVTSGVLPTPGPPGKTPPLHPHRTREGPFRLFAKGKFLPLFDPGDRPVSIDKWPRRLPNRQRFQFLGDLPFGPI